MPSINCDPAQYPAIAPPDLRALSPCRMGEKSTRSRKTQRECAIAQCCAEIEAADFATWTWQRRVALLRVQQW